MATAVVQFQVLHGPTGSPSLSSAEGGLRLNRSDDELAAKAVPAPATAPASVYSNYKSIRAVVTTPGTTDISNLAVRKLTAEGAGLLLFRGAAGSYARCTGDGDTQGNRPADSTSALSASPAPNTPATYNPITTSFVVYDSGSYDTSSPGAFGDVLSVLLGISSGYGGDGGDSIAIPGLYFRYSEQ